MKVREGARPPGCPDLTPMHIEQTPVVLTSNDNDTAVLCTVYISHIDPARIDRRVDIGDVDIGAGRAEDVILRANGTDVRLRCPTSGITEETTSWRRIVQTSDGCLVESSIGDLSDPQRSRHSGT